MDFKRTSRHTGHPSASAVAVAVAGGLKRLAFLVSDAVDLAAQILLTCGVHRTDGTYTTTPAACRKLSQEGRGLVRTGGWMQGDPAEEDETERLPLPKPLLRN